MRKILSSGSLEDGDVRHAPLMLERGVAAQKVHENFVRFDEDFFDEESI